MATFADAALCYRYIEAHKEGFSWLHCFPCRNWSALLMKLWTTLCWSRRKVG